VTLLQAVVLGIVQGVTEWLPVSSTAHLILVPWLLGWPAPPEHFLILVQVGTLAAVLVYFRADLLAVARGIRFRAPLSTPQSRLGWWMVLGTVPAVAVGLPLRHFFRDLHGSPAVVAAILLGATVLLFVGERFGRKDRGTDSLGARDALAIGAWQAVALFPGVSRSAATIAGGMLAGLDRASAARFSFLLSVPILLAAGAIGVKDLLETGGWKDHLPALAAGFLTAAVVGYAVIHWLLGFLARRPLTVFAWYRIGAGLLLLGLALRRA
jgi:undecaprenyl-diphosphatase